MSYARIAQVAMLLLAAEYVFLEPAVAAVSYVNAPGIQGVDPTPGYPGAMAASSVTITPHELTIIKSIDPASPQLFAAIAMGTPLGTVSTLFYNGVPAGPPDATLSFFNSLGSSIQSLDATTVLVRFNAQNPLALFLEVPGIPGESNAPGHPNIMYIRSFELVGNEFRIGRAPDSASDDLFLANAMGVQFPFARLILSDSTLPDISVDAVVEFHNLLIRSSQVLGQLNEPIELHKFNFATLSQVPEPVSVALAAVAGILAARMRRGVRGR